MKLDPSEDCYHLAPFDIWKAFSIRARHPETGQTSHNSAVLFRAVWGPVLVTLFFAEVD